MAFYDDAIQAGAQDADIDPRLLKTVGALESSLGKNVNASLPNDPDSPVGFFQIRPSTARAMLGRDPQNLQDEATASARYLRQGLDTTGHPQGALAYYFAGPDQSGWGPKTAAYVTKGQAIYSTLPASAASLSALPPASGSKPASSAPDGASTASDDPDVAAGRQLYKNLTTTNPPSSAAAGPDAGPLRSTAPAADDPDVAAGMALYQQLAKPTETAAPAASAATPAVDDYGRPIDQSPVDLGAVGRVAGSATQAAVAGAKAGASIPLPDATGALRSIGVYPPAQGGGTVIQRMNEAAIAPMTALAGGATRLVAGAGNALLGAYQGGVSQAGAEIGQPQLGRDLAALPEAFPAGHDVGVPIPAAAPTLTANRLFSQATGAADITEAPMLLGQDFRAAPFMSGNKLLPSATGPSSPIVIDGGTAAPNRLLAAAPDRAAPSSAGQSQTAAPGPSVAPEARASAAANGWRPLQPGEAVAQGQQVATGQDGSQWVQNGAPVPNSVGAAATPGAMANMSPAEQAASQARSEQYRLANPRTTINGVDQTQYVPGVTPTRADVSGSPADASWQKFYENQVETKDRFLQQQANNNNSRVDYYNEAAGDRQTLANAVAARDTQAQQDLSAAWQNKTDADAQPVLQQINSVLAGPAGKQTAVSNALNQVRNKLYDAAGNLETDPEILYGVRQEVANLLGKSAQQETPTLKNASRQLSALKDTLDGQIELAAPGYQQYLSNYTAASRPIDSMQVLQDALPNLQQGADKSFTFTGFNRFMKGVVDARQSPGVAAAKSLDDATMDRLWNIYADLHRQQQTANMGTVKGSPTQPWLSQMGSVAAEGVGHVALGAIAGPGIPNMLLRGAVGATKNALQGRRSATQVNRLLDGAGYSP